MAFGIDDAIAAGLKIVDKLIPDPMEKARAQMKVLEMKQAGEFKEIEATLAIEQELTKRSVADAGSDSWLAKNIRPIIMLYFLTLVSLMAFDLLKNVKPEFVDMIKSFTEYGLIFYFGGRTIEKVATVISNKFGKEGK